MRKLLSTLALGSLILMATDVAAQEYKVSVSLDTGPSHVRNLSMHKFAAEIAKRSGGKLTLEIFDSASQYRGPDVAVALAQGAIDMGVPADQHVTKFVPNAGILLLPMVYGLPRETLYKFTDGPLGDETRKALEDKLGVVVLGRSIDIGHGTVFTTDSPIVHPDGLNGRKVRVPGGAATLERYRVFGSSPVQIAWSDLPQALERGTIQTVWATHESIRSAKLWDAGIKYTFDDRQAFVQYVPMLSKAKWDELPEELRKLMRDTWDEMADGFRNDAARMQEQAMEINRANGITVVLPDMKSLNAMRSKLLEAQPTIVEKLKMDPEFVKKAQAVFDAASK